LNIRNQWKQRKLKIVFFDYDCSTLGCFIYQVDSSDSDTSSSSCIQGKISKLHRSGHFFVKSLTGFDEYFKILFYEDSTKNTKCGDYYYYKSDLYPVINSYLDVQGINFYRFVQSGNRDNTDRDSCFEYFDQDTIEEARIGQPYITKRARLPSLTMREEEIMRGMEVNIKFVSALDHIGHGIDGRRRNHTHIVPDYPALTTDEFSSVGFLDVNEQQAEILTSTPFKFVSKTGEVDPCIGEDGSIINGVLGCWRYYIKGTNNTVLGWVINMKRVEASGAETETSSSSGRFADGNDDNMEGED